MADICTPTNLICVDIAAEPIFDITASAPKVLICVVKVVPEAATTATTLLERSLICVVIAELITDAITARGVPTNCICAVRADVADTNEARGPTSCITVVIEEL